MNEAVLARWQRRLEHLLMEEAKVADSLRRFALKEEILETKERIAELVAEMSDHQPGTVETTLRGSSSSFDREKRAEVLLLLSDITQEQYSSLVFLLEIPIQSRPRRDISLSNRLIAVLEWVEEKEQLADLLEVLKLLADAAVGKNSIRDLSLDVKPSSEVLQIRENRTDVRNTTPLRASEVKGKIHAAIITIRQDEYEAMEAKLGHLRSVEGNNTYKVAEIISAQGERILVALTRVVGQGNGRAQSTTSNIIHELDPAWLILVGIAGGVPDYEFSLGDVVLATYLHDFSLSAAKEGGVSYQVGGGNMHREVERFISTKVVGQDGKRLEHLAGFDTDPELLVHPKISIRSHLGTSPCYGSESYQDKVRESVLNRFPRGKRNGGPVAYAGPCANGNVLLKDADLLQEWQQSARQIVQIETELSGVYEAARTSGRENYPILSIRGLSDIVGLNRDAAWTPYACKTAAAYAYAILQSGLIDFSKNLPPSPTINNPQIKISVDKEQEENNLDIPTSIFAGTANFSAGDYVSRYITRANEEEEIISYFTNPQQVSPTKLVTIHAEGGMGKSRLAVACASKMRHFFQGGIYFIGLTFTPPKKARVVEAIGQAVSLPNENVTPDNLFAFLNTHIAERTLFILDNYESVKNDEVDKYLSQIVAQIPQIFFLVTGREILGVENIEQLVSLGNGMSKDEARTLFLSRASLKQYKPISKDERHLSRILRLTSIDPDGERMSPLAIELAAAWSGRSTIKEIADGLGAEPLGRFSALPKKFSTLLDLDKEDVGTDTSLTQRVHNSLARSLNWSFNKLGRQEDGDSIQRLLSFCGLFAGSFDPDALIYITGENIVSESLQILQEVSLIRRVVQDGNTRYYLHRFIREYALYKLEHIFYSDEVYQKFVQYYVKLVEDNAKKLEDANSRTVLDKEWRSALSAVAVAEHLEDYPAIISLASLDEFLFLRSLGLEWENLDRKALYAARFIADRPHEAIILNNLGLNCQNQGRFDEAFQTHEKARDISQEINDQATLSIALLGMGNARLRQKIWSEALDLYDSSLHIKEKLDPRDILGEARIFNNIGNVYFFQDKWDEALIYYEMARPIFLKEKYKHGLSQVLNNIGLAYDGLKKFNEAIDSFRQSFDIKIELGNRNSAALTLENMGNTYKKIAKKYRKTMNRHKKEKYLNEAIENYSRAQSILNELNKEYDEGRMMGNIAITYADGNNLAEALRYAEEAIPLLETGGESDALKSIQELLVKLRGQVK